ncbi:extracellular endoglucanase precursor [Pelomyxa schiedti]|nr:extracellular endoglucanase precursor [Pelomyxa schiedti]
MGVVIALLATVALGIVGGVEYSGYATYYDATGGGACSFDESDASPLLVCAINSAQYGVATYCGSCLDIVGPSGEVNVTMVDECPGCSTNSLDLSPDAFKIIAGSLTVGKVKITWNEVPCQVSGMMKYSVMDGANTWWLAIQPRNYPINVEKVWFQSSGSTTWTSLTRQDYNYWVATVSAGVKIPVSLKLESVNGETVIDKDVLSKTIEKLAGTVVQGTVQFTDY